MHKLPTNCGTPSSSNSGSKGGVSGEVSVYVGNLDPETPLADLEDLLYELFLQAGPLTRVYIPFSKDTGKHKCYGFVEFRHLDSVPYAILLLHGIKLCGKTMNVKRVTPPSNTQLTSSAETTSLTANTTTTTTPPNPFFAALQAGLPPPPLPITQTTPISLTEYTPMSFASPQPLPPPMLLPPPNLALPTPPHLPDGIRPMFPFPPPPFPLPTPPHGLPPPFLPFPPFTPPDVPPLPPDSPFSQPPPFPVSMTTDPQSLRDNFLHPHSHLDTEPMEQQLDDELPFSQPHPFPASDSTHTHLHEARLQAHDHPRWLRDDAKQLLSLYHIQQLGQTFTKLREAMADGPP